MSGRLLAVLAWVYLLPMLVGAISALTVAFDEGEPLGERRHAARIALASLVWPLALLVLLVRRAVQVFRLAFAEEES